MAGSGACTEEAIRLLEAELRAEQPSVMRASLVLGVVQDALLLGSSSSQQACSSAALGVAEQVAVYASRYQELLLQPAAARLAKAKTLQDKVIAISKLLWTKLQKVPSSKQPLHQQYLTCALRDSGKRQLDCLGIATAVLALCHDVAAQHAQHARLASARMMVSDDHCWIVVGEEGEERRHIEVTDSREVVPDQLPGWLYAGSAGVECSSQQVVLMLVAALAPEEVKDAGTAAAMRAVQRVLLERLSEGHPGAMLYSTHFRWGMLLEEDEVAALQHAADAGDLDTLRRLTASDPPPSQQLYARAAALSPGRQWNPVSCAAFGRLFWLQAALCGTNEDGLAVGHSSGASGSSSGVNGSSSGAGAGGSSGGRGSAVEYAAGLQALAVQLMGAASGAVGLASSVLGSYAGLHHKQRDATLVEAIRDLFENHADAGALLCEVQRLAQAAAMQVTVAPGMAVAEADVAEAAVADAAVAEAAGAEVAESSEQARAAEVPAAVAAADAGMAGVSPAVSSAADAANGTGAADEPHQRASCSVAASVPAPVPSTVTQPGSNGPSVNGHSSHTSKHHQRGRHLLTVTPNSANGCSSGHAARLDNATWLAELVKLMDAVLVYLGEEQAADEEAVDYFLAAAACYSPSARSAALQAARPVLVSGRLEGLQEEAWAGLGAEVKQQIQMPGSRARKRARR